LFLSPVEKGQVYHLRRYAKDRGAHQEECRHFAFSPGQLADMGFSKGAIKDNDDGELRIDLDFGLIEAGDEENSVSKGSYVHLNGRIQQTRSRATLLGLLHLLWTRAGLNRYEPFRGLPKNNPWERLRWEARRVIPNSMHSLREHGLSSVMLLPLAATEEEGKQANRNYAKLASAHKRHRVMFVCLLYPEHVEMVEENGCISLEETFGVGLTLLVPELERAFDRFPVERAALKEGYFVIAFGVAKVQEYERGQKSKYFGAVVERLALMAVTRWFIPVESSHERTVADWLEDDQRGYMKPLRYDAEQSVHPDFVLTDVPGQFAMEVYGMDTPEYLKRKKEKQAIYEERLPGRHWQWDVLHESLKEAMKRLPNAVWRPVQPLD
jgi:hypothetical protein